MSNIIGRSFSMWRTCGDQTIAQVPDTCIGTYLELHWHLLGGSWDLVTTYNWAYNLTYNPPKRAYRAYPNYK